MRTCYGLVSVIALGLSVLVGCARHESDGGASSGDDAGSAKAGAESAGGASGQDSTSHDASATNDGGPTGGATSAPRGLLPTGGTTGAPRDAGATGGSTARDDAGATGGATASDGAGSTGGSVTTYEPYEGCDPGGDPYVSHDLSGVQLFPSDNPWNTPIPEDAEIDPDSATMAKCQDPCWGVALETGMPYNVICNIEPSVTFQFKYTSDPGPYPITSLCSDNPKFTGACSNDGLGLWQESGICTGTEPEPCADSLDHHVLIVDPANHTLYELYNPRKDGDTWRAASGAIFDISSNTPRTLGGSADAAGLPILPGLVRCDEIRSGEIKHALRFTLPSTKGTYVYPAQCSANTAGNAPMGARFRLRLDYDISNYSENMQVVLRALKKYGMFLADNGMGFAITAEPSESCWMELFDYEYDWGSGIYVWDKDYNQLRGNEFEVIKLGEQHTGCKGD